MIKRTLPLAIAILAFAVGAVAAPQNGDANVTVYAPADANINYQDKTLANYQDPYLSNARAYKSNQFGKAAEPPKPNLFYTAPHSVTMPQLNVKADTDTYVGNENEIEK